MQAIKPEPYICKRDGKEYLIEEIQSDNANMRSFRVCCENQVIKILKDLMSNNLSPSVAIETVQGLIETGEINAPKSKQGGYVKNENS